MLFMELQLGYIHSFNTHTHTHAWQFCSPFLFPSSLPAPPELNCRRQTFEESCGGEHFPLVQNETSLNFLSSVLSLFSFFSSPHPTLVLSVSISLFSSQFLPFFNLPHIYIIFCYFTHSFFFLPSVPSVCGPGNSLGIPLWANKMTHCFLITSALSYSQHYSISIYSIIIIRVEIGCNSSEQNVV